MTKYHPWRRLRSLPHIKVICRHELPPGTAGLTRGNNIWLHRGLDQKGRRSTLAHELEHVERGIHPGQEEHPWFGPREERTVEQLAARRLITLDALIAAMRWTTDLWELSEELWVDMPMVQARLRGLTPDERTRLNKALEN
ncbi:ImmA/IrrE family metallo-endopeptidase [Rhodococcus ruber]|uniref:ImmA/IrrE family metallo-endopeptidase n=1 Tax=Rhodococcus ruber TaxID=1830 RepID=UPI002658CC82|nr:ImmA/IrrE family metallo-endopeptidase [Rhodococcus ruber]WKK11914.1 ImmA/IrrE family metallo-endopeptidase [Rhodococcus ruber]WKK11997.1 ImmA/IrrE family metallo-endopeptidase [Rhodococcus ruber]